MHVNITCPMLIGHRTVRRSWFSSSTGFRLNCVCIASLLPMTPEDLAWLAQALGDGPVTILSRGYGNCRITATAVPHVFWVKYFNAMDQLILDTLEVVDVPEAALAAKEDLEDSTARLEEWLLSLEETPPRLALRQPTYERLTEAQSHDLDAPSFFRMLRITPPVRGLPRCVIGREVGPEPERLDARATDARGAIEIFRFTKRFVLEGYTTKSLRCRGCAHDASCEGMHVNQVRAHGYAWMSPIAQE